MTLNGLVCADVPLRNYSPTPPTQVDQLGPKVGSRLVFGVL